SDCKSYRLHRNTIFKLNTGHNITELFKARLHNLNSHIYSSLIKKGRGINPTPFGERSKLLLDAQNTLNTSQRLRGLQGQTCVPLDTPTSSVLVLHRTDVLHGETNGVTAIQAVQTVRLVQTSRINRTRFVGRTLSLISRQEVR